MDQEASLANDESYATTDYSDHENTSHATLQTDDGFNIQWNVGATGPALFAPTDLPLSRPLRAYERQPKSPFARRKVRFSKIYKRTNAANTVPSGQPQVGSAALRLSSAMRPANLQSPTKAVKKLCLSSDYGPTSQVLSWDARGSPARKIRTRSSIQTEELVELQEESDVVDGNSEQATFEVVNENGETIDTITENSDDWEDEDSAVGGGSESTSTHVIHPAEEVCGDLVETMWTSSTQSPSRADQEDTQPDVEEESEPVENVVPAQRDPAKPSPQQFQATVSSVHLPAGFVSPVKRRRTVKERMNASSYGSRRRTLPVEFAPAIGSTAHGTPSESEQDTGKDRPVSTAINQKQLIEEPLSSADGEMAFREHSTYDQCNEGNELYWNSGIEEKCSAEAKIRDTVEEFECTDTPPSLRASTQEEPMVDNDSGGTALLEPSAGEKQEDQGHESESLSHQDQSTVAHEVGEHKCLKQHSPFATRRSPRRNSTSPPKKFTVFSSVDKPHLVAFTPIKRPSRHSPFIHASPSCEDNVEPLNVDFNAEQDEPLERSASAPPEDPIYVSPKRQPKPRVSDDTALLQAFLDRAAAGRKTKRTSIGRKTSISKRESMENRRDSGTVREALAANQKSPSEMKVADGILTDRDVNSPSPKKLSPSYDEQDKVGKKSNLKQSSHNSLHPAEKVIPASKETSSQVEVAEEMITARPARRSTREKKTKQADLQETQAVAVGPNKISVRGNADPFVLRKTEAQELAFLTRTNTVKNKGGAVFPQARLVRLACEEPIDNEDGTGHLPVEDARQGRLRWREILVEYSEAVPELVGESSELSETGTVVSSESLHEISTDGVNGEHDQRKPPAPCDTPSKPKPKIRRLRPPRTATTPSQADCLEPLPAIEDGKKSCDIEDTDTLRARPASLRKRSRIATPAKKQLELAPAPSESTTGSLNSQRSRSSQASSGPTEKASVQGKRRAATSRLPAPSTTLSASQSKETATSLPGLASPPKKKTGSSLSAITGLQSLKTFAPQLSFGSRNQANMTQEEEGILPGLMSPAKKARSRRMFAGGVEGNANELEVDQGATDKLGFSSPAKKRSSKQIVG